MENSQEGVLDRMEKSFNLYKKGFTYLFLPLFLYKMVSFIFFIIVFLIISFGGFLEPLLNNQTIDFFSIFTNGKLIFLVSFFSSLSLLYLFLYLPFYIYTVKTIKDIYNGNKVLYKENLKYGFNNFFTIMKTYRYIFAYVALLPSIVFIVGGFLFNLSYFLGLSEFIKNIGLFLMIIGFIIFLVFVIYRGLQTKMSVVSAIDTNEYSKENFNKSLDLTKNKWWRIFGNFLLVGIIIGLLSGFAKQIFGVFFPQSFNFFQEIDNGESIDFKEIISGFSYINFILNYFSSIILNSIGVIFTFIFTYLFFKDLSTESNSIEKKEEL